MTEVHTTAHFEDMVTAHGNGLVVVNFWADWAAACKQITQVVSTLESRYPSVCFLNVEAEKVYEVAEAHNIESVPTVLLLKSGGEVGRVTGVDVPGLTAQVEALSTPAPGTSAPAAPAAGTCSGGIDCSSTSVAGTQDGEDLNTRLSKLVASSDVMLFMKGTRDEPRCGFSRKAVTILNDAGVTYSTFDILGDEEVRQGLKTFSNWPTYPQLYSKGKLLGGLDIMEEMRDEGELLSALSPEDLNTRLSKLVASSDVMLFMKGTRDEPRCGFSRKAVTILNDAGVTYSTFDILGDEEVRQGLKTFSNWPTYPQLYSKGKLLGGLDIMEEMRDEGELLSALSPEDLNTRLSKLVASSDVMLFMKGTRDEPRCGFSRKAVTILNDAGVTYSTFDILGDEEVRQGLKTFSNWPTYPQLYSKGKLLGGLDIMEEMRDEGELLSSL